MAHQLRAWSLELGATQSTLKAQSSKPLAENLYVVAISTLVQHVQNQRHHIMATVNVYEQYFEASGVFNGVERRAASVMLISDSEAGSIRYEVAVSFFPHHAPDDFAVSYDAYFSKVVYEAKGRRSKKREAELMETLRDAADALAAEQNAAIDWDKPLIEARRG